MAEVVCFVQGSINRGMGWYQQRLLYLQSLGGNDAALYLQSRFPIVT